jgi:hypothetical protein
MTYKNIKDNGRIECRDYYITSQLKWLDTGKEWKKLSSIGMVIYHSEKVFLFVSLSCEFR